MMIPGKWKVIDVDFIGEGIDDRVKSVTRDVAHSVKYEFNTDFSYRMSSKLVDETVGTWKYHSGRKQLILQPGILEDPIEVNTFFTDENTLALHFEQSNTILIYHLKRITS
ncbi:MAG: hypothetical protein HKN32_01415 [Flavobacteriales bacterium]|nr:hypothetical protein [Flavobacteriales bacterium]